MEALRETDPAHIGAQTLLARLGAGGMGQVYLGRSPGGRLVAVKVIREEITGHPEALARFRREAETVRAVRSAYTANLIDASLAAPPYWLATEYVAGPTLSHAVAGYGALPAASCRRLFAALAEGLASVHAYGVTHRDLKPQNVILGVQGPQLIDFGIAKGVAETALTQVGAAPGTPGYTAPEVLLRGEVAAAADVFALGATIAYAATGRAPYGTGEPTAVNFRAVHGEIDVEGVEPELAALIRACVATDPAGRPALAEVIRRCAVDAALVDDPVYAALTAAGGGAAQVPGLPSTIGPGLAAVQAGYVPTYAPAAPAAPATAPAATGTRTAPRWALAAVAGLVAGGLVTGGY
ncbi:serine/threonine-protein kinase, partial [Streptomyces sp. C]|uniref:serine/threonine-protein kinase n=1 Tax=Streptomyces sp. C TaxID=253839 RepID=UPI0001B536FD